MRQIQIYKNLLFFNKRKFMNSLHRFSFPDDSYIHRWFIASNRATTANTHSPKQEYSIKFFFPMRQIFPHLSLSTSLSRCLCHIFYISNFCCSDP